MKRLLASGIVASLGLAPVPPALCDFALAIRADIDGRPRP
jgi:hypothetical protein